MRARGECDFGLREWMPRVRCLPLFSSLLFSPLTLLLFATLLSGVTVTDQARYPRTPRGAPVCLSSTTDVHIACGTYLLGTLWFNIPRH